MNDEATLASIIMVVLVGILFLMFAWYYTHDGEVSPACAAHGLQLYGDSCLDCAGDWCIRYNSNMFIKRPLEAHP